MNKNEDSRIEVLTKLVLQTLLKYQNHIETCSASYLVVTVDILISSPSQHLKTVVNELHTPGKVAISLSFVKHANVADQEIRSFSALKHCLRSMVEKFMFTPITA